MLRSSIRSASVWLSLSCDFKGTFVLEPAAQRSGLFAPSVRPSSGQRAHILRRTRQTIRPQQQQQAAVGFLGLATANGVECEREIECGIKVQITRMKNGSLENKSRVKEGIAKQDAAGPKASHQKPSFMWNVHRAVSVPRASYIIMEQPGDLQETVWDCGLWGAGNGVALGVF